MIARGLRSVAVEIAVAWRWSWVDLTAQHQLGWVHCQLGVHSALSSCEQTPNIPIGTGHALGRAVGEDHAGTWANQPSAEPQWRQRLSCMNEDLGPVRAPAPRSWRPGKLSR